MADYEAQIEHNILEHEEEEPSANTTRRAVLQAAIGVGVAGTVLSTLYVGAGLVPKKVFTPENEPLAAGDILVYAQGPNQNKPINPADLKVDVLQIIAYPMNPKTNVVKGSDPNNTVLIVKIQPSRLTPATAKGAVDGIVAYSGVCKHLGCIVSNWDPNLEQFVCPCHQGHYDPANSGKVMSGPPPKPIPQLPIKIENNQIIAMAFFLAPPGVNA
ncbi:MAG: Rieske 2Fe-2S domain-containing protein [Thermaceae bacterium]|nr:Rieske 2Fe-2S domain-containing protein [Thermaceae bacterium]